MFVKINSCATIGVNCQLVEIEASLSRSQQPAFIIVGLPDAAIQEAKERVRLSIENSKFKFPRPKITINLAPADLRKEGSGYDLGIAVAILKTIDQIKSRTDDYIFFGQLALDGSVRPTQGILPITAFAKENNYKKIFIPRDNYIEASLIEDIEIVPISNLTELVNYLDKNIPIVQPTIPKINLEQTYSLDMADIYGQEQAKRALEIAAAGGHNVLLSGPPGSGKTLLAKTLPTILPTMTKEEILAVTKIYSISGLLPTDSPTINQRPFRSPHHTSSGVSLVGGGKIPKPGEITLAHKGVLFLDELPEFPKQVLENLRQPLEDGQISISRAQSSITFPASFILIASQNPCPCGYASDPEKICTCTPNQILFYQKKVSGPLLDRIDLHIEVPRLNFNKLTKKPEITSKQIREQVELARKIQLNRFKKAQTNSEMTNQQITAFCQTDEPTSLLLKSAIDKMGLSARSYHRILKISRTIADLAKEENIKLDHVAEALQFRQKQN